MAVINLSQVARKIKVVDVEFDEDLSMTVGYKPNVVTSKWISKIEKAEKSGNLGEMAQMAATFIDSWEFVMEDEDGEEQPVPVEPEMVEEHVPMWMLSTLLMTCAQDAAGAGEADPKGKRKN